ncbi:MAG: hypothetical protein KF764_21705 [Labilithrix sp.]|nr:hypothetical protein [Labilithrix sp.]MBX3221887.1 hypothetical protein [Labilithrix sp.]
MTRRSRVFSRAIMSRALPLGLAVAASLLVAPRGASADSTPARADETRECAAAYEQTQRQQQKSELIGALASAERCARSSCPALLKDECARWVTDLRPKLPSLVVRVRGGDGCARTDAKLEVDGATRKDPRADALLVDPGVHVVKVTDPASGQTKAQSINFAPGERRDIDVDFASDEVTCGKTGVTTPVGRIPTVTLVLGSIGAGLVVAGATVGLVGASKRSDLDDCKPGCTREQIDDVRPFFLAGDVLAGFGILALGAAAVTYFARDTRAAASTRPRFVFGASGVGASF